MKTSDKPTLQDLFESKKLDVPSDEFWDDFQEKVREKALSTVLQRSMFSTTSKMIGFSVPASFVCILALFFYFQSPAPSIEPLETLPHSIGVVSVDNPSLPTTKHVDSYVVDSKLSDHNLYVHNSLQWSESVSFEEPIVQAKELNQPGFLAQYTF
jgi:hypothetical protein